MTKKIEGTSNIDDEARLPVVVAMIRYARGVPGFENEMPHVVSCNDLPDGLYPVYLAPPAQLELVLGAERDLRHAQAARISELEKGLNDLLWATAHGNISHELRGRLALLLKGKLNANHPPASGHTGPTESLPTG